MSVYYVADCDELTGDHVCDPCEDQEGGGVRSVALIKKTLTIADPTNPVEWEQGIANGDIIVIPEVRGTYDGGTETEGPGYGDQATRVTGMQHQLEFRDPNYRSNGAFWNAMKNSSQWKFAYRTETLVHMIEKSVSLMSKNPVEEDVNTNVTWLNVVKWSDKNSPLPYAVPPGIFDRCVAVV